jgi:hypothetical protein
LTAVRHRPGGALVGLLDFRGGQMAAERQAEQLPADSSLIQMVAKVNLRR